MAKCPMCNQEIQKKVEREDLRKVVTVFKMVTGYDKEDKAWDRLYFSRYMKPAKQLLEFMGNWRDAGDCIQDIYERFTAEGLTVTLETIIKHAAEWKKDKQEREAKHGVLHLPSHGSNTID